MTPCLVEVSLGDTPNPKECRTARVSPGRLFRLRETGKRWMVPWSTWVKVVRHNRLRQCSGGCEFPLLYLEFKGPLLTVSYTTTRTFRGVGRDPTIYWIPGWHVSLWSLGSFSSDDTKHNYSLLEGSTSQFTFIRSSTRRIYHTRRWLHVSLSPPPLCCARTYTCLVEVLLRTL